MLTRAKDMNRLHRGKPNSSPTPRPAPMSTPTESPRSAANRSCRSSNLPMIGPKAAPITAPHNVKVATVRSLFLTRLFIRLVGTVRGAKGSWCMMGRRRSSRDRYEPRSASAARPFVAIAASLPHSKVKSRSIPRPPGHLHTLNREAQEEARSGELRVGLGFFLFISSV